MTRWTTSGAGNSPPPRQHKIRHRTKVFVTGSGARFAAALLPMLCVQPGIEGLTRTLLVNCRRAAVELGWRSTRSAASVLAQSRNGVSRDS